MLSMLDALPRSVTVPEKFAGVPESIADLVQEFSERFDAECQARHVAGAEKYGPAKFLSPDTDLTREIMDELLDAANYARYYYIRLAILTEMIAGRPVTTDTPRGPQGVVTPFRK